MGERYPFSALAAALGESEQHTFRRLRVNGARRRAILEDGVDIDQAERWALKLGLHPFEVWPEMVDEAALTGANTCPACGSRFVPGRYRTQVYCSRTCKGRVGMRRLRQDPEYRERERQREAVYRDEARRTRRLKDRLYRERHGDWIRAKARARYRDDPEYRERRLAADRRRWARKRAQEREAA